MFKCIMQWTCDACGKVAERERNCVPSTHSELSQGWRSRAFGHFCSVACQDAFVAAQEKADEAGNAVRDSELREALKVWRTGKEKGHV